MQVVYMVLVVNGRSDAMPLRVFSNKEAADKFKEEREQVAALLGGHLRVSVYQVWGRA